MTNLAKPLVNMGTQQTLTVTNEAWTEIGGLAEILTSKIGRGQHHLL